jgi:hypothetical protein
MYFYMPVSNRSLGEAAINEVQKISFGYMRAGNARINGTSMAGSEPFLDNSNDHTILKSDAARNIAQALSAAQKLWRHIRVTHRAWPEMASACWSHTRKDF